MWRVTADFADLSDGGYVYHAGDNYPRSGMADPQRVAQLAGRNNKRGMPLIEPVPAASERQAKKRKTEE